MDVASRVKGWAEGLEAEGPGGSRPRPRLQSEDDVFKLNAGLKRCPLCSSYLLFSLDSRPRCLKCGLKLDHVVIPNYGFNKRRPKRTYADYEKRCYHRALNYIAAVLKQRYGVKVKTVSYGRSRFILINDRVLIVFFNSMYPVQHLTKALQIALNSSFKVIVLTSSIIQLPLFSQLKRRNVKVIKTGICYRVYDPRVYRHVKTIASELRLLGIFITPRFTLKALIHVVEKLLHEAQMKLARFKPGTVFQVKGLESYAELHIHGDGVFLCQLIGFCWIIKRVDNAELKGLIASKRLKKAKEVLCQGRRAPDWFKCSCLSSA